MSPFKLIFQHHLAIDIKRFTAFAAGFKIKAFLHGVGILKSLGFKGVLFAR